MSRSQLLGRIAPVLLFVALAAAARGDAPLTTADVVRFLQAGHQRAHDPGRAAGPRVRRAARRRARGRAARGRRQRDAGGGRAPRRAGRAAARRAGRRPRRRAAAGPAPRLPPRAGPRASTFGATARSVRVRSPCWTSAASRCWACTATDFQLSEDGTAAAGDLLQRRAAAPAHRAGPRREREHGATRCDEVADALRHFIDLLEPADEILVITFSDRRARRPGLHLRPRAARARVLAACSPTRAPRSTTPP